MYRQFYEGMSFTALPLIALALFVGLFAFAVLRVFTRRRPALDRTALLPLDDEPSPENPSQGAA